jgi:DUF4097 and DUF4098 domain-containing protein YvlB
MNKIQFLATLRRLLNSLPEDESERILTYYRETIENKVKSGWTEEDAVSELGNVYAIAEQILAEHPGRRRRNTGRIIFIGLVAVLCLAALFIIPTWLLQSKYTKTVDSFVHTVIDKTIDYEYQTRDVSAEGITSVSVSAEDKAVVFQRWSNNKIEVKYPTAQDQTYDFECSGSSYTISNQENGRHRGRWTDGTPTITVMLPENYSGDIQVDTTNSYVKLNDFQNLGTISCSTTNSAIEVKNLSARSLSFMTTNAAINLKQVTATEKIEADTQNAQIGLQKVESPDISLHTTNALVTGTIVGREEDYSINASTTNAISNLQNRSGGSKKLFVETTNAIINLNFEE